MQTWQIRTRGTHPSPFLYFLFILRNINTHTCTHIHTNPDSFSARVSTYDLGFPSKCLGSHETWPFWGKGYTKWVCYSPEAAGGSVCGHMDWVNRRQSYNSGIFTKPRCSTVRQFSWLCSTQCCFLGLSRNSVSNLILFNKPFLLRVVWVDSIF